MPEPALTGSELLVERPFIWRRLRFQDDAIAHAAQFRFVNDCEIAASRAILAGMSKDPRIDQKIAAAQPFAQPILSHIRAVMHEALPQVVETIKWGMPFYLLNDRPFAMMSSFKAHAAFGFWKGRQTGKEDDAMGQFGRITALDDLPPKAELIALIHQAVIASEAANAAPPRPKTVKAAIEEPEDLTEALKASPVARAGFDALPPGARREYLEWIVEAKRAETRASRIEKAVAQAAEGKKLHWKYENC